MYLLQSQQPIIQNIKYYMKQTTQLNRKDIEDYIENYTSEKDNTFKFTVFGEFNSDLHSTRLLRILLLRSRCSAACS
jgi:hypothetical protein